MTLASLVPDRGDDHLRGDDGPGLRRPGASRHRHAPARHAYQMIWPQAIEAAIAPIKQTPFLGAKQKRDILHDNARSCG
jgi:hypothetical protein